MRLTVGVFYRGIISTLHEDQKFGLSVASGATIFGGAARFRH